MSDEKVGCDNELIDPDGTHLATCEAWDWPEVVAAHTVHLAVIGDDLVTWNENHILWSPWRPGCDQYLVGHR